MTYKIYNIQHKDLDSKLYSSIYVHSVLLDGNSKNNTTHIRRALNEFSNCLCVQNVKSRMIDGRY